MANTLENVRDQFHWHGMVTELKIFKEVPEDGPTETATGSLDFPAYHRCSLRAGENLVRLLPKSFQGHEYIS